MTLPGKGERGEVESSAPAPETPEIGGKPSPSNDDRLPGMSPDELSQARTGLAIQRTLMGADRTLMAWVRTSLSMSSFGFTLYKVLQGFQQAGTLLPTDKTPRQVGLFLIGLGTAAMVLGIVDYWLVLRELRLLKHIRMRRPVMTMAILMAVFGVALFVSVVARVL